MCFNHYFVTDVKHAYCRQEIYLSDLSNITQLIDEEDLKQDLTNEEDLTDEEDLKRFSINKM